MRVAHFSDLHLLELGGAPLGELVSAKILGGALNLLLNRARKYRAECFAAMVDDLNAQGCDHIVCTGDLVNLALPAEFALAQRLCGRLQLGPADVTIVPGNHDYYTSSAVADRRFERAFGPYATGDGAAGPAYPFLRLRGEVAIVGLSSACASPAGFAYGVLGARQLAAAEGILARPDVRERFRLVLLHHPPIVHRGLFVRQLRDRAALGAMLARAGADLVVHGHDHVDEQAVLSGPAGTIPVVGVGAGSLCDSRPERVARYHVFDITDRRLARVTTRYLDLERYEFREVV